MTDIIIPAPLKRGDKVAIISPSTEVKEEYVDGASAWFETQGYNPLIAPHAKGPAAGSYASEFRHRLDDLLSAFQNPEVKAIMCARGGYGAVHLLPYIPAEVVRLNPKWIIGFSDISALHAFMVSNGVASLHAPMGKHLTIEEPANASTLHLANILAKGEPVVYDLPTDPRSICGTARGRLFGGNLAVLNGLAATPYDILSRPLHEDAILFIEDISEKIYAVERMLWRLYLSGALSKVKGLIIGSFTDYPSDRNFPSMEEMIAARLKEWHIDGIPVAYGFPCGHTPENLPLIEGAEVLFAVDESKTSLVQIR